MKNIKKISFSIVLAFMIALCPILCMACCENQNNYGENISKALSPAIAILKEHTAASNSTSASSVQFEEVAEDVDGQLFILDYIKAIATSSKFEYTTSPFKGTATVSQDNKSMTVLSFNRFSIVDNNVSVEMNFAPEGSLYTDYEWMQIDYDFTSNQLNSFEWYGYTTYEDGDDTFYCYKYQNETLSKAVEDDNEYIDLKNSIKNKSLELVQSQDFTQKVYDFTSEYIDVYNTYNPESQIH